MVVWIAWGHRSTRNLANRGNSQFGRTAVIIIKHSNRFCRNRNDRVENGIGSKRQNSVEHFVERAGATHHLVISIEFTAHFSIDSNVTLIKLKQFVNCIAHRVSPAKRYHVWALAIIFISPPNFGWIQMWQEFINVIYLFAYLWVLGLWSLQPGW